MIVKAPIRTEAKVGLTCIQPAAFAASLMKDPDPKTFISAEGFAISNMVLNAIKPAIVTTLPE